MTANGGADRGVEQALAAGDFGRALELLRAASAANPGDLDTLLKLAGVSRAAGRR